MASKRLKVIFAVMRGARAPPFQEHPSKCFDKPFGRTCVSASVFLSEPGKEELAEL